MVGWQRHLQPLVRQVAKRYVCCRSASFSTFNQAKASLVSGEVSSLQSLRNSLYPTISRPLFQHIQKLEFTSSKILQGAETQKAASKSSKGTKQRRSSGISINNNRKNTRFAKQRRGRMKGISHQGNHISFGNYALQALEPAWITSRQIEAGRRAMTRNACRGVKVWVRLFPDKSVTARPTETRMGRGKGAPQYSVAVVQPGRILYEMGGVTQNIAKKAIEIAASKMPIQTRFIVSG